MPLYYRALVSSIHDTVIISSARIHRLEGAWHEFIYQIHMVYIAICINGINQYHHRVPRQILSSNSVLFKSIRLVLLSLSQVLTDASLITISGHLTIKPQLD
eukprot:TRINITY_DN10_c0_g2_i1.p1 TRINITY_DN10_c0_g2~~TRINITY_DN10_c0_g2_i1.p1  ORF type:complete len:102 (+),score=3.90 TRINITY_DN10_c0_g2_i1:1192-1497(+)